MGPLLRWLGSHIPSQQRPAQSDLAISWVGKNRIEKRLETLLFSNQVTQKKNIILIIYYQSLLSSLLLSLSLLIFPSKIHFFGKQWSYKSKTFFHKFSIRLPMTPVDWLRCHKGPGFHRSAAWWMAASLFKAPEFFEVELFLCWYDNSEIWNKYYFLCWCNFLWEQITSSLLLGQLDVWLPSVPPNNVTFWLGKKTCWRDHDVVWGHFSAEPLHHLDTQLLVDLIKIGLFGISLAHTNGKDSTRDHLFLGKEIETNFLSSPKITWWRNFNNFTCPIPSPDINTIWVSLSLSLRQIPSDFPQHPLR